MNSSTLLGRVTLSALLLAASPAMADDVGPVEFVDAFNKVFGQHRGARANPCEGHRAGGSFHAERFGFLNQ